MYSWMYSRSWRIVDANPRKPLSHRINAGRQERPSFRVTLPRYSKRNRRVLAEAHQLLFAFEVITPAPELSAGWCHPDVQTAAVAKTVGLSATFDFLTSVSVKGIVDAPFGKYPIRK